MSLERSVTLTAVQSLADLEASLSVHDDLWDERAVLNALVRELQAAPPFLEAATGEWDDPYLVLSFTHNDGALLQIRHGDGYTAIDGAGLAYKGYLDSASLIDVLRGALFGGTSHVRRTRAGRTVGEYFEVVGREGERLGLSSALGPTSLLRLVPVLPESTRRTRISFQNTCAAIPG